MGSRSIDRALSTTAFALLLVACGGGGGGGGSGFVSTPPPPAPPPPPPPPPPPNTLVKIFPNITETTDFTVLGYENPGFVSSASQLVGDGFSVRYDASTAAYVIDVPSAQPGRFGVLTEDADFWNGVLLETGASASILKPDNSKLDFIYTTFGDYFQYEWGGPIYDGVFAFGLATPTSAVPVTGSASYSALLLGRTLDWSHDVTGTAMLQFNFGAGTLTGYMEPTLIGGMNPTVLGRYNFVNTIYSVGSSSFAGGLKHDTYNLTGNFNGIFTGPAAQELMARWIAQYRDPLSATSETKEMFGVLVGKKP